MFSSLKNKITSSIFLILPFWNVADFDILNTSPFGDLCNIQVGQIGVKENFLLLKIAKF